MGSESTQKKLDRVRKPRVHITYEVETEGAQVVKELPFVVGVLGDFSGQPTEPLKPLKDRKFIQIDRDNFNDIMAQMAPELNLRVENTLAAKGGDGQGSELAFGIEQCGAAGVREADVELQHFDAPAEVAQPIDHAADVFVAAGDRGQLAGYHHMQRPARRF